MGKFDTIRLCLVWFETLGGNIRGKKRKKLKIKIKINLKLIIYVNILL